MVDQSSFSADLHAVMLRHHITARSMRFKPTCGSPLSKHSDGSVLRIRNMKCTKFSHNSMPPPKKNQSNFKNLKDNKFPLPFHLHNIQIMDVTLSVGKVHFGLTATKR